MQNLERRPSGIYVARLTIPARLRSIVGSTVFIASTGTPHLAMAKLVASELLAGWRRQLFELERLTLAGTSMNEQSIVRIADGHPLLRSATYLPLRQAAAVLGLDGEDLLRQVADGQLSLFCRLMGDSGYLTSYEEFEPDDPDLGTVLIPSVDNRPTNSRLHRAFGVYRILKSDAMPLASGLLAGHEFDVLVLESLDQADRLNIFVPSQGLKFERENIEISAMELDAFRRKLAESITSPALEAARLATRTSLPSTEVQKAKMLLSEAVGTYSQLYLPQMLTSEKEIDRIRTGIALLAEFEGDLSIGAVTAEPRRYANLLR